MKKVISIIICAVLVLSIIGNIYLYMQNGDINLSLENSQSELSSVQTTLSEKETALSDANVKIEELEGTVTDLQSQITELEKQIQELKDQLDAIEKEKAEKEAAEEKAAEETKTKAKAESSKSVANVPAAPAQDIPIISDDEFGGPISIPAGTQGGLGEGQAGDWADGVTLY